MNISSPLTTFFSSNHNRSTFQVEREKLGCGRRSRTFIFEFKARRVAGYTIPQKGKDEGGGMKDESSGPTLESSYFHPSAFIFHPCFLVAVEGVEPASLDYRSSALAVELHREVVDPTGLKPAPHGLKGRRSVTRAPGQ
jgi:hypothetical protein